jgi:hypothetical protein
LPRDPAEPTDWESLLSTVVQSLIRSLPELIRNGVHTDQLDLPPYTHVPLPDIKNFDTKQNPPLCPFPYLPVDTTRVDATHNQMNGLDTIQLYGPITFPVQDVQMRVPLLFHDISLCGEWHSYTNCRDSAANGIEAEHNGSFTFHFREVQFTLSINLDEMWSEATSVSIQLSDGNLAWAAQPWFDPNSEVTFGSATAPGQQMVILALLQSELVKQQFRDPVKKGLEGHGLADELCKVFNQLLSKLMNM